MRGHNPPSSRPLQPLRFRMGLHAQHSGTNRCILVMGQSSSTSNPTAPPSPRHSAHFCNRYPPDSRAHRIAPRTPRSFVSPKEMEPAASGIAPSSGRHATFSSCPPGAPLRTTRRKTPYSSASPIVPRKKPWACGANSQQRFALTKGLSPQLTQRIPSRAKHKSVLHPHQQRRRL